MRDTVTINAYEDCPACHGRGYFYESHPWGSTYAVEELLCDFCLARALDDELITEEEYEDAIIEIVPVYEDDYDETAMEI